MDGHPIDGPRVDGPRVDGPRVDGPRVDGPRVDGPRLLTRLRRLAQVGGSGEGVTRLAWSPEDREGVALVAEWARQAGATVRIDPVGNLIAERPGSEPDLPPLVTGSHLDTVVGAGSLDGAYGVVAGAEVMASLHASGIVLRHPLRLVGFANEEGVVAPPFTGSRAIAGQTRTDELSHTGPDGRTLTQRMREAGCRPDRMGEAAWNGRVAATIELHVEQGPYLDQTGTDIGVVTAITAQQRGTVAIAGETNHAGTTPMRMRRDALVAASMTVLAVRDLAVSGPAGVATVGRLRVEPGVPNVIAGGCELSFDIRSADDAMAGEALSILHEKIAEIGRRTGCTLTVKALPPTAATPTDKGLREMIAGAARSQGLRATELASGAGHDCAHLAALGPVAMIFVPSTGGVSHSPAETTPDDALVAGAAVLAGTVATADVILDR